MGWRAVPTLGLLAMLTGCGTTTPAEHQPPKVGQKAILPAAENLYRDLDMMRKWVRPEVRSRVADDPDKPSSFAEQNVVALVGKGSLVEVLEVWPDAAAVIVVKDERGATLDRHGYLPRWW